jgi:hypothetical protein
VAISSAGISFSNAAHSPVLPARRRSGLQDWRLCIFIFIAALATAQLCLGHLKGDTAWFMTFAEEYAAGLEPYAGISSPNPPPAFLALCGANQHGADARNEAGICRRIHDPCGSRQSAFCSGRILQRAESRSVCDGPALDRRFLYSSPCPCFLFRRAEAFVPGLAGKIGTLGIWVRNAARPGPRGID